MSSTQETNTPKGARSILSGISVGFANNLRATFLLFLSIILMGVLSYTVFLQRDGFPNIEVPIGVITVRNFESDASINDEKITSPIEESISALPEVTKIMSTTTDNFVTIIAQFENGLTSKEGLSLIKSEINENANLDENITVEYLNIKASSIDGENDLLFTISSNEVDILQQQQKAFEIAKEIEKLSEVVRANVIEQVTPEVDAEGNEFLFQSKYQRVGIKNSQEKIEFQNAVAIGVVKSNDSVGTIELSDAVRNEVKKLQDQGQLDGYQVQFGGDLADALNDNISSLEENALSGLIIVVIIAFLFISWRASIIIAMFIPTVMAAAFVTLFLFGYSLNILTLFALILTLGLLVDDAIIVVEAIEAKRREGLKRIIAIKEAIQEIGPADVSGTLTTLLVFMPLLFVTGVLGEFIVLIPATVILTLSLSLVIALTIMPLFSGAILSGKAQSKRTPLDRVLNFPNEVLKKVGDLAANFVDFYLSYKIAAIVVALIGFGLVAFGTSFASRLEFNIFPENKDSDDIYVVVTYFPGTSVESAENIAIDIEQKAKSAIGDEYIDYATYYYGDDTQAYINFHLVSMDDRKPTAKDFQANMEQAFSEYSDALVTPAVSSVGPPSEDYQFFMQVFSEDQDVLEDAMDEFSEFLANREISEGENVLETFVSGLEKLEKKDGRRYAEVKAKLSNKTDTSLVLTLENDLKDYYTSDKLKDLGLSSDSLEFDKGQESENLDSFNSTIFAFGIALVMMYALLVVQFNSFSQPVLVMLAIPLSFVGLFPGLFATDNALSFFVMIGITGLAGIVVNNTIMLIDFANQSRLKGIGIRESIVYSVRNRFRALVTTSATTIAGLMPLALSDPFWESLAFSIIFGLAASTTMVILVFPVYYAIVEKLRSMRTKLLVSFKLV